MKVPTTRGMADPLPLRGRRILACGKGGSGKSSLIDCFGGRERVECPVDDPSPLTRIDVEAGIEHFGRGVEQSVDAVLVVVDPASHGRPLPFEPVAESREPIVSALEELTGTA